MASTALAIIQSICRTISGTIVSFIAFLIYGWRPKKTVPPVTNPLLLESGLSLARKIRKRQVTSVEVIQAYITRIEEVNPLTNAVIATRFDEALDEAKAVDAILDSENIPDKYSEENAPYLGVPFTVKEAFAVKGLPNSSGVVARKDMRCTDDAVVIRRMREAGAIPIALTNVSELCMWYESNNCVYGRSNNAYDNRRMVGGSSGGEGANLAASGSVIGIGSDIGGSIRMPCFFNGIFGHKTTTGIVPNVGQFPCAMGKRSEFLSTGPMCRYAADLEPMLSIMAGEEGLAKMKLGTPVDLRKLKYFSIVDDGGSLLVSPVSPELKAIQAKVVKYLEDSLEVTVTETQVRRLRYSFPIWSSMMSKHNDGQTFTMLMGDSGPDVKPALELLKWIFQSSNHTLPAIGLGIGEKLERLTPKNTQEKLCKAAEKLQAELEDLLGSDGILLYPSHPKVAPYHNSPLCTPFNFAYTGVFNILGFPITQVPLGLNEKGIPLGIQVIARRYNDHLTLAVARQLEEGFGGWREPIHG
ncbi:fatty-acid amide hydrolase 2-A-like [Ptychodera flava]|uniref:fatty-acid amide hydrolase 2-A-like n=1 Tax=Ptychodera flava TaxID=63121 RepID=UPI003969F451